MIQQVIFRPAEVEDIVQAAAWDEAHAPALGEELNRPIVGSVAERSALSRIGGNGRKAEVGIKKSRRGTHQASP